MDFLNGFMDPKTQALLAASGGLLAASAPRGQPVGLGQALGQGILSGVQGYQQGVQAQRNNVMYQFQLEKLMREKKQQEALAALYGPQASQPASSGASGETPAGMSQSTSMGLFGTPEYATQPPAPALTQQRRGPSLEQIGGLASLGVKVDDHLKLWELMRDQSQPKMEVHGGYAYNPRQIQPGFLPQIKLTDDGKGVGVTPSANGGLPTVSALPGSLPTFTAFQNAAERAKADYQPFTIKTPAGDVQVPLSQGMDILRQIQGAGGAGGLPPGVPAADADAYNAVRSGAAVRAYGNGPNLLPSQLGFSPDQASQAGARTTAEGQASGWVKREETLRQSWNDANGLRGQLDLIEHLSKDPNVLSGRLADEFSALKGLGESFGVKAAGLPAEEVIKGVTTEMSLKQKNQGGTNMMPGAMSDFEQNLLKSMTPQLAQSREGRFLMIQVFKAKADRDQKISEMAADYVDRKGRLDNGFEKEVRAFSKANPMFSEERAKAMQELAKRLAQSR